MSANTTSGSNLVLIGYRGAGKTSVGRRLAERLRFAFVDTDAEIAAEAGISIAEIFATEGEAGFRHREAAAIREATSRQKRVLSVGGGAVLQDENVDRLRRCGFVIWLTAPPEVLWSRIERDEASAATRPALSSKEGLAEVQALLAERQPRYRRASHATVDTSAADVDDVTAAVLAAYELLLASPRPD